MAKLTEKQRAVLRAMANGETLRVASFANTDQYTLGTLNTDGRTVSSLEKRGFVEMLPRPIGRFHNDYKLTELGRAAIAQTAAAPTVNAEPDASAEAHPVRLTDHTPNAYDLIIVMQTMYPKEFSALDTIEQHLLDRDAQIATLTSELASAKAEAAALERELEAVKQAFDGYQSAALETRKERDALKRFYDMACMLDLNSDMQDLASADQRDFYLDYLQMIADLENLGIEWDSGPADAALATVAAERAAADTGERFTVDDIESALEAQWAKTGREADIGDRVMHLKSGKMGTVEDVSVLSDGRRQLYIKRDDGYETLWFNVKVIDVEEAQS